MKTKNVIFLVVLLVIVVGTAYWLVNNRQTAADVANEEQSIENGQLVKNLVINFGTQMQTVSLSAPSATAEAAISGTYSNYASPDLLAQWEADPKNAPGRLTSSPWHDHILVDSATSANSSTYNVQARVIEMTSTGYADQYSVTITVAWVTDRWLITSWTDTLKR